MNDIRTFPLFHNPYGPVTLLGNWAEDRCAQEGIVANQKVAAAMQWQTTAGGEYAETSNATLKVPLGTPVPVNPAVMLLAKTNTPQEYAAATKHWAGTESTYQEDYGKEKVGESAEILRQHGVAKELLLANGEVSAFEGVGESTEYGKWFVRDGAARTTGGSLKTLTDAERRAMIRTLYDSNFNVHKGNARPYATEGVCKCTFADTVGTSGELARQDCVADDRNAQPFLTTKISADLPVADYFFQRTLPPPS